ncbi:uncharacterized protein LOC126880467 [Diabrotica virgifera virgifera]|uniref:Uncharacterized protein n=1 Tax=Diabrotica virgifera virgifera TaxID=50390 RepID=A0ABM5JQR7_DIAVI|nr:uncharacterized protein LOC126880467 [Diabrotica virgifera virgifera]
MRNFDVFKELAKDLGNLSYVYARPASQNVNNQTYQRSDKLKRYFKLYAITFTIFYCMSIWFLHNVKDNIAMAIIKSLPFCTQILFVTFAFIQPHSVLFCSVIMSLLCYFIYHLIFNLHNLNEELITLINKKNYHIDKFNQINCVRCQKDIFQEMVYLFNQYLRIKQAVDDFNDFFKWRVLALIFAGSAVTGSSLVFIIVCVYYFDAVLT